jgi:hypothetical protein
MALQKLTYRAGINREGTDYSNEGGFYDGDKVRFRSGQAEKIGGWIQVSPNQYLGVARSLWTWVDLNGLSNYLSLGTNIKYYLFYGGTYNDITPIVSTNGTALAPPHQLAANPISTVNGSNIVTITDGNYSPSVGDYVIITSSATVGGISINGEYIVKSVPSPTTYTIQASANAGSTASGGGTVSIQYEYPVGLDVETIGTGWGTGPWGGSNGASYALGNNPFATTNTSGTVVVTQTAHGYLTTAGSFVVGQQYKIVAAGTTNFTLIGASSNAVGTIFTATGVGTGTGTASIVWVAFTGSTSVDGLPATDFNNTFEITYINANSYSISVVQNATSTTTGGGSAAVVHPQYSSRTWGSGYSSGIGLQLRLWTNDNYGSDLALAPRGGPIFYWQSTTGVSARAQYLSDISTNKGYSGAYVPTTTNQILSAPIQQFLIALGSNSYLSGTPNTQFNPMTVRWSDQANQYQWVPSATNQSGEFTLTNGSYIVCGRSTRQEILIWTNSCLYSMQYIGYPYIWSFQVLMDNISIIAPNAAVTVNNVTYWMGKDKFYTYTGVVSTLPCSLRQYIFDDINTDQAFQIFAGSNEGYNEVWWFYCSKNSNTVNKYVIYNYLDKVWSYGTMARTAWLQYGIQPYPIGADYNSRLLYHEVGNDDVSTSSPQPIEAYVQSSDFGIEAGEHLGFVWRMLPDINFNGSTVNQPSVTMTLFGRENSGSAQTPSDIDTVTSPDNYTNKAEYIIPKFTGQVYTRIRARQMSFEVRSKDLGVSWQLGVPRIDTKPAGRR